MNYATTSRKMPRFAAFLDVSAILKNLMIRLLACEAKRCNPSSCTAKALIHPLAHGSRAKTSNNRLTLPRIVSASAVVSGSS